MKTEVTSKHLQGITDLTLLAPIKQGLISALDTRTYATRLKLLMKSLNALRSSSREFSAFRPFSDAAERISTIHSLRLAIIELGQKQMLLLAVTFDRPWEPYIRIIWRDVGTLLDLIFCNCDGYVPAYKHSCADYFDWVRKAQIDAQYFYNAGPLTVDDLQYLRKTEKLHREMPGSPASDRAAVQLIVEDPEDLALAAARRYKKGPLTPPGAETTETIGLKALTALYRLTDVYPADKEDGGYLLRAAHDILKELRVLNTEVLFPKLPLCDERRRFGVQLAWFETATPPEAQSLPAARAYASENIQGGIVTGYVDITHGCVVLMSVTDAVEARRFLASFPVTTEQAAQAGRGVYFNIALTCAGLRRLGVADAEIDRFPKEFREGMEARADLLGDCRGNHPRNWAPPDRNWPSGNPVQPTAARVELSTVDILVQLRCASPPVGNDHEIANNPGHPLYREVETLALEPGLRVLSVQAMRRYVDPVFNMTREHFGFLDGISQPDIGPVPAGTWNNNVPRGELLRGYENANGDAPVPNPLLDDGTFLVIRKLRQDVPALNSFLGANAALLPVDQLKAKMMGRTPDGDPLANSGNPLSNSFDYEQDKDGARCPFQAHIRRTNPRTVNKPKVPRIVRRGMSYGPQYDPSKPDNTQRGLVFMAYNASIAEQFEVIQRWISGGNSSGAFSGQSDPFLGVPQMDDPRTFRFVSGSSVLRAELDSTGHLPFVQLEWGAYLFVPSPAALKLIAGLPGQVASSRAEAGEKIVQDLLALEREGAPADSVIAAWKARLEDFDAKVSGDSAAVWAAIRERHNGVLRTAYGVLVASARLVGQVFDNANGCYSVMGYHERMSTTIGANYLGLDDGPAYRDQSGASNGAILEIAEEDAFNEARAEASGFLNSLFGIAVDEVSFDTRELSDQVLARLSQTWFGLPDNDKVAGGGWSWNPIPPRAPQCPGDFTSPSRYLFSPNPGAAVKCYAEMHGQALHRAALDFVQQYRAGGSDPPGVLSGKFYNAIADDDQLARTIVGAMMGFLPTVDGNLRSVLYDWMDDGTLWRLQEMLLSNTEPMPYERAKVLRDPLMRTMQRRPVPDLVWRTALKDHDLESIRVQTDDKIVVGIVSATEERLANGDIGVFPVFGGNRVSGTHPTHACPAYKMAMGILLGVLSALLEAGMLRPTPSPTGLTLIGRSAMRGLMKPTGNPVAGPGT